MFAPDFYRKMERTRRALIEDLEKNIKNRVESNSKSNKFKLSQSMNLLKKKSSEFISNFGEKYFDSSQNEQIQQQTIVK
jgi:hypothetical protein